MERLRFVEYRGTWSIFGSTVNSIAAKYISCVPQAAVSNQYSRDGADNYHLTIVSPAEINAISRDAETISAEDIVDCGLCHMNINGLQSWSVFIYSPRLQDIRRKLGLPEKRLHITLGFYGNDTHDASLQCITLWNSISNLIKSLPTSLIKWEMQKSEESKQIEETIVRKTAYALMDSKDKVNFLRDANSMTVATTIEYLKELGRISMQQHNYSLAEEIGYYLISSECLFGVRLILMSGGKHMNLNIFYQQFPMQLTNTIANREKIEQNLIELNHLLFQKTKFENEVLILDSEDWTIKTSHLPRNFSWVVLDEDKYLLAGSAIPTQKGQIAALKFVGISTIFTIHETSLPTLVQHTCHQNSIETFRYMVHDRTPPSKEQMLSIIPQMHVKLSNKKGVLIHCQGGVGRTNTVIASYLMSRDKKSASDAINEVTEQRKIILSESQKGFLRKWYFVCCEMETLLPSSASIITPPIAPSTVAMKDIPPINIVNGVKGNYAKTAQSLKMPPIIMLCGIACSGKSTFAKSMVNAYPDYFIRVNRDEMRGKGQYEDAISKALQKYNKSKRNVLILDACHLTKDKRKEYLQTCFNLPTWCVYFERSLEECQSRITVRGDHPTIPAGTAGLPILQTMIKQWQTPTTSEGFEKIFAIHNDEEIMNLLWQWKIPFQPPNATISSQRVFEFGKTEASTTSPEEMGNQTNGKSDEDKDDMCNDNEELEEAVCELMLGDQPIKFPRTAHAINLGAATRDDKILPVNDVEYWIKNKLPVIIEEKIDGANIGFWIRSSDNRIIAQNRSHFISSQYHPQFQLLDKWIAKHTEELWEILQPDRQILFGEWLYALHSVKYTELPAYFIAYDLYDIRSKTFLSRPELAKILSKTKIPHVHCIYEGRLQSIDQLKSLVIGPSVYGAPLREGIVIRICNEHHLNTRAKLVRTNFIAGNERWNKSSRLETNELKKVEF